MEGAREGAMDGGEEAMVVVWGGRRGEGAARTEAALFVPEGVDAVAQPLLLLQVAAAGHAHAVLGMALGLQHVARSDSGAAPQHERCDHQSLQARDRRSARRAEGTLAAALRRLADLQQPDQEKQERFEARHGRGLCERSSS